MLILMSILHKLCILFCYMAYCKNVTRLKPRTVGNSHSVRPSIAKRVRLCRAGQHKPATSQNPAVGWLRVRWALPHSGCAAERGRYQPSHPDCVCQTLPAPTVAQLCTLELNLQASLCANFTISLGIRAPRFQIRIDCLLCLQFESTATMA